MMHENFLFLGQNNVCHILHCSTRGVKMRTIEVDLSKRQGYCTFLAVKLWWSQDILKHVFILLERIIISEWYQHPFIAKAGTWGIIPDSAPSLNTNYQLFTNYSSSASNMFLLPPFSLQLLYVRPWFYLSEFLQKPKCSFNLYFVTV